MMGTINHLTAPDKQTISRLVDIWESAVKKTHKFLSETDIIEIKLEVCQGLKSIEKLYAYYDSNHIMQGFVGIINQKIDRKLFDKYARRYSPHGTVASLYLWAISSGAIPGMRDYAPEKARKRP